MCCFLSIDRRTNGVGTSGGTLKDRIIDGGHKWAAFVQNVNAMNLQVMIALTAVNVAPIVLWFWKAINQAAQVVQIPLCIQNWICTIVHCEQWMQAFVVKQYSIFNHIRFFASFLPFCTKSHYWTPLYRSITSHHLKVHTKSHDTAKI